MSLTRLFRNGTAVPPMQVIEITQNQNDDLEQGRHSSQESAVAPKSRVIVEQPDGTLMLGEDPFQVQVSEEHPYLSSQRESSLQRQHSGESHIQHLQELVSAARYNYRMRRNAFILMLILDFAYLVFAAIVSLRSATNNDKTFREEDASFLRTLLLVGRGSPGIILFALVIDILGLIACLVFRPGLIAIYIILMSCVLAVDAFTGIGPLLVIRVLLIFMAFKVRRAMFDAMQHQQALRLHQELIQRRQQREQQQQRTVDLNRQENDDSNVNIDNSNSGHNSDRIRNIDIQSILDNNENQDDNGPQVLPNSRSRILVRQNAFRIRNPAQ
eukprot:TRINITY_DN4160_c1_g2_i2.p2 TRINITY_DN4160_c1_g2~~TRINITY_DN4160_c1_g2_i2.p2  ORF type:complete len:328 (-),score=9.72 TRINITY_DN4160_c1_g2_i2:1268-2251(-)